MLEFTVIPVTAFQQNCSLVWDHSSKEAAIVDPGGNLELIKQGITERGLHPTQILITHAHIDHIGGVAELAKALDLPIIGPQQDDAFLINALDMQSLRLGLPKAETFTPQRWLQNGDEVKVGDNVLSVRHCPGHTPGHVAFISLVRRIAWVGDILFKDSIGRTDLPGGNTEDLLNAIRTRLFPLGDDIEFIPGHGPLSTFGRERRLNPYVGENAKL